VRDELVETLGKDTARMKFASQPPTVVLMAGLQGSGKTTTSRASWRTGSRRAGIGHCWFLWTCTVPQRASS
jgi:pantothenate kinase-related protein Tda10